MRSLPNSAASALPKDQLVENDVLIALDGHVVYKMPLAAVMKLLTDGTRDRICTLDFHRRDPDCDTNIERALAQGSLKRCLHFLHRPAESQVKFRHVQVLWPEKITF